MTSPPNPPGGDSNHRPDSTPEEPPARRPGRPTKLTKDVAATILQAIADGNLRDTSARLAGIDPSTLCRWMKSDDEPYCSFAVQVEKVEAQAEAEAVAILRKARAKSPAWAAWWLERRRPDVWGGKKPDGDGKETEGTPKPVIMLPPETDD